MPDPKYMTFVEHLQELRYRLMKSAIAIAIGSIIGWFIAGRVITILDKPVCHAFRMQNCSLVVTQVYGAFTLNLKIAIMVGFVLALPVTVYQLWKFVAPAFGAGANKWAPIWMSSALLLFAAGAITGYFVIPLALTFFAKFSGGSVTTIPFATDYINFVLLILIVFGVSYELPLVLVSLTSAGITSSDALAAKRLYFFFGLFIFATIATPGADWISPLVLGGILYVLFEAAVLVSRLLGK